MQTFSHTGMLCTLFACLDPGTATVSRVRQGLPAAVRAVPQLLLPDSGWVTSGDGAHVRITGLPAGARVTIRARRTVLVSRWADSVYVNDTVVVESWARYAATPAGHVDIDRAAPLEGSWSGRDPLGLFWSMRRTPLTSPAELTRERNRIDLTVAFGDGPPLQGMLRLRLSARPLVSRVVVAPGLVGAFVAPRGAKRVPVVIALHGSEGGDTLSNVELATRFAARGYAAFAVSYVAYPWNGGLPGVPTAFDSIAVETLDRARTWLGARPEVDTSRTALWGVSKGGEFAMVTAARRRWPRAVIGCVPSDVMWAGYGRDPAPGEVLTSWSDSGARLPAIPYDDYADVFAGRATPRQVHDRSRTSHPADAARARIPVEVSDASLLLLGAERDEVWASGAMVRSLLATLRGARPQRRTEATVYPDAGHGICGLGTSPVAAFGDTASGVAIGTAKAAADAWLQTVRFLRQTMPPTPKAQSARATGTRG